jgi:hypothetical protein
MQIFLSTDFYGPNDFRRYYEAMPCLSSEREAHACWLLDISKATLKRYLHDFGRPPKALVRLLYLESHHGRRHAAIDLFNDFQSANQRLQTLLAENARLNAKIASVNRENDELRINNSSDVFAANSSFYAAG